MKASFWAVAMVALFAFAACHPSTRPNATATFPAGWRFKAGEPAPFAEHAMVVSNSDIASRVGAEIMRRGGNAVDAAVAVGFAMTVTYPVAGNIGGGGFMVIRLKSGESTALDYRETAPARASRDMYLDSLGKLTKTSIVGHLAVGVPGSVSGMIEALNKYGTMPLRDVIAPAIALADTGWVVDSAFSRGLSSDSVLLTQFEGRTLFFPGGARLQAGARLAQPELAWTLRQISERGASGFYEGPVADSLVGEM